MPDVDEDILLLTQLLEADVVKGDCETKYEDAPEVVLLEIVVPAGPPPPPEQGGKEKVTAALLPTKIQPAFFTRSALKRVRK